MRNQRFVQYHQRILELDPIAYWVQDEKTGLVSYDWARRRHGSDQDGAYTGTTPGQPGAGDGRTSQFFDGVNDYNNIFTPTLQGRFNGSEGTLLALPRVAQPPDDPWTDGVQRRCFSITADGNNFIRLIKRTVNNSLLCGYRAGGIDKSIIVSYSSLDFFHLAITWSAPPVDEVRVYLNGVQQGATLNGLGVWVGAIDIAQAVVGAFNTTPLEVWHGDIAHAAPFDRALTAAEIAELAVV